MPAPPCLLPSHPSLRQGALSAAEVGRLNATLDSLPRPDPGQWIGRAHFQSYFGKGGGDIQQVRASSP